MSDWLTEFAARHTLPAEASAELAEHLGSIAGVWPEGAAMPHNTAEPHHADLDVLSVLGTGGMGEVFRVSDPRLHRQVALKALRPALAEIPAARARFIAEAQATAQLEHPGIVPVYTLDQLTDGRPCFTMREVQGQTLGDILRTPREASWSRRRLLEVLGRVCETVAYTHDRGVLHRDLKPDNIMVGSFGQVFVMDWGLVQITNAPADQEPVVTDSPGRPTTMAGTPRYLAPEQRRGEPPSMASDVYALGLVMWEMLCPGPLPLEHPATTAVESGTLRLPANVPDDLAEICVVALSLDPSSRYDSGTALAVALQRWLTGEAQRDRARALLSQAAELLPQQEALQAQADAMRAQARVLLVDVPPSDPIENKRAGWTAEDAADAAEKEATALQRRYVQQLQAALSHAPELPEALQALARHHRSLQILAEPHRPEQADYHAAQLRHYDRGEHDAWLRGDGTLTLHTHPTGATVTLSRYVEQDRVLRPVVVRTLGTTPLRAEPVPMGRWLLTIEAAGHAPVRFPIAIRRQEHWHGIPPGQDTTHAVPLPRTLTADECYVPAGWYQAGIASAGFQSWPAHQHWVDGFVMQRFSITNRDYLAFIQAQLDASTDIAPLLPRDRGNPGTPCYGVRDGRVVTIPDPDGDLWALDWPVFLVDWHAASAYATWWAERTGQPWRLPSEWEWEKAGRGSDGRIYPWGDRLDPTFTCIRESHPGAPMPSVVQAFPTDESVYGVRGLAGNVREWCGDAYRDGRSGIPTPGQRVLRGGCWFFPERGSHLAARFGLAPHNRGDTVGFRLVRPWPAPATTRRAGSESE